MPHNVAPTLAWYYLQQQHRSVFPQKQLGKLYTVLFFQQECFSFQQMAVYISLQLKATNYHSNTNRFCTVVVCCVYFFQQDIQHMFSFIFFHLFFKCVSLKPLEFLQNLSIAPCSFLRSGLTSCSIQKKGEMWHSTDVPIFFPVTALGTDVHVSLNSNGTMTAFVIVEPTKVRN